MSNLHHDESVHANASQAPAAMRELTLQEMLAVVGGPEIRNGDTVLVFTTPTSGS